MTFNRRELLLLVAVAILVALYAARSLVRDSILGPLQGQRAEISRLELEVTGQEQQIASARQAQSSLAAWQALALPRDEQAAQSQYQQFLFDLVQQCSIEGSVITPGAVQRDKHFTRIPFRLTGQVSVENLTEFLYRFSAASLLHQMRRLEVHRSNAGDQRVNIVASVEGLSLHEPPADAARLGDVPAPAPPANHPPRERFNPIAEKNIFAPYREPVSVPVTPQPEPEPADQFVYLTGTPDWGEGREAWFTDRRTNEQWTFRAGEQISVVGVNAKLLDVRELYVDLEIDGRRWRLRLNENLREMRPVDKK